MAVEVLMPRLTDTMHKGLVTYWYKSEEENTQEGEPLFVVETDKATVEVNACATGVLLKILVTEGQAAEVGERVAIIGENGEDFQALMSGPPKFVAEQKEADLLEAPEERATRLMASPAAKRRAKEENVDLKQVRGTGDGGLITQKDVDEYVNRMKKPLDAREKEGSERRIPLDGVLGVMARRTALNKEVPQVTTVAEVDVTDLIELSRKISVTITSFVVKAVVENLRHFPVINASLDGNEIVLKNYYNVGISVATPRGLVVPVLRHAENYSLGQVSDKIKELASKAKENQLTLEEISGGTFTVTNSGVFGSLFFTPIVIPPESAILGMGKIMKQPVVEGDGIFIRSMMYLSLSYDHRIIDGENAVKFLQKVKLALMHPSGLL